MNKQIQIFSNPRFGKIAVSDKHIKITLLSGEALDEYDMLALAAHSDEEWCDEVIRTLDRVVPVSNDIYFALRCVLKQRNAAFKVQEMNSIDPKAVKTYLMVDLANGYIKIGKSIRPPKRERTLQSEKPSIKLLKVCDKDIERELHRKYAIKHIRGEWYHLSNQDIRDIVNQYGFHKP